MRRKPTDASVRRVERINLGQVKRVQRRPKKTWMEVIRQDIEAKGISEGILLDRNEWRSLSMCPIRCNFLLVNVAYPIYLGQMAYCCCCINLGSYLGPLSIVIQE